MDRALNLELLGEALGVHANLPAADELGDLLAQAEINLFFGGDTDHSSLLRAAWYLHAIAGGTGTDVPPVRRQRAGAVSAHIFDVFMQSAAAPDDEDVKLRLLVAAQYGYLVGTLTPNAGAMALRLPVQRPSMAGSPGRAAMYAAALLLGLQGRRLREGLATWTTERAVLTTQWQDIDSSPFGAAAAAIAGVGHLTRYLRLGDDGALQSATAEFRRALDAPGGEADTDSRWVAALLLDLGDDLARSSVWAVLGPNEAQTARAFVLSDPSVLMFWPPQAEFLKNDPSPLDLTARRQVLAFPTSAGKTLVSQVMTLSHLRQSSGDVCVIAPTHSLCREIREALSPRLSLLRTDVVDAGPDGSGGLLLPPPTSRVTVMTPERFSGLLRTSLDQVLERYSLFIIDEAHLLAERERGWRLEEALTLIHHLTATSHHRIVLVSAAMGTGAHVASWLTTDQAPLIKSNDWRGPRRLYSLYTTEFDPDPDHTIEIPKVGAALPRRRVPVLGRIHLRSAEEPAAGSFREPVGHHVFRQTKAGGWTRDNTTTPQLQRVVPLVQHLVISRATPTLVIVATREDSRKLATGVSENMPPVPELSLLADRVQERVGEDHTLPALIRRGVAYHHGALPTDVQAEIEDAARAGQIKCLVATATLTEGVNLPFKAVVIGNTGFGPEDRFVEIIDPPRLVNALGRAGRAGRETEAWLFLVRHKAYNPTMFDQLRQEGADLPLRSSLLSDSAMQDLADFEAMVAAGQDAVLSDTGRSTNDFCAFVWHLSELLGALGTSPDLDELLRVVESSLAWAQADETTRDRWRHLVARAKDAYDATPPNTRRRYATSGASLAGAVVLDAVRGPAVDAVLAANPTTLPEWIDALLGGGRLEQALELPENTLRGFRKWRTAPAEPKLPIDLLALLGSWVAGDELESLGATYLAEISDTDYRAEALSEFTSTVFEHHLPWALGSLVEWVNEDLQERALDLRVPATLASHIHYGAATPTALELMAGGVRSRRLAHAASNVFGPVVEDLRSELRDMDLPGWQERLGAYPSELRDLLSFVRREPQILADVLNGETAHVGLTRVAVETSGPASLVLDEDPAEPRPFHVIVGDDVVGDIPLEVYEEVRQLVDLGFDLDLTFDHEQQALALALAPTS